MYKDLYGENGFSQNSKKTFPNGLDSTFEFKEHVSMFQTALSAIVSVTFKF